MGVEKKFFIKNIPIFFLFYGLVVFIITTLYGGIDLNFPPKFNYTQASSDFGGEALYSPGVSKFYGFVAIGAALIFINSKLLISKLLGGFLLFLFLILSVLGGSRGDALGAFILIFLFLLYRLPVFTMLSGISIFLLISVFLNNLYWIEDLILINRLLTILDGDFGMRDILFSESITLLISNNHCLFLGCGFGIFQEYHGYSPSLYPHNTILESLLVFGVPLSMLLLLISFAGFMKYIKENNIDYLVLFYLYSLILELKSGSLFVGWLFTSLTLAFALKAFDTRFIAHNRFLKR